MKDIETIKDNLYAITIPDYEAEVDRLLSEHERIVLEKAATAADKVAEDHCKAYRTPGERHYIQGCLHAAGGAEDAANAIRALAQPISTKAKEQDSERND